MKYLSAIILCFLTAAAYGQNYLHPSLRKSDQILQGNSNSSLESAKIYGQVTRPSIQTRYSIKDASINLEKDFENYYNSAQMVSSRQKRRREFLITEKPKEITLKEYHQAKKYLYHKMRESESVYKKSGYWLDLSYEAGNFTSEPLYSVLNNALIILKSKKYFDFSQALTLSMGKVIKGLMIGGSFHYRMARSWFENREGYTINKGYIPYSYGFAGILGYRIAPDNGIGMRLMLHTGYGFSPENLLNSKGQQYKYHYVIITPEYKMDIKLVSALVWTIGIAYQYNIQLSGPAELKEKLFLQDNWNFSTGLALNY